ncbi:hypothetical protein [Thermococcus thermotolerans]|uniref:hypothetical protein n=1 Tax=Thermococcus thermotolerans TaxID=2969672 RepID=UPI0021570328|nr:hypothetical protein [Thermococcus thermotolerans]
MGRGIQWFGVLLASMLFLMTVPHVLSIPYWVKPGVYVKYAALRYEPYVQYKESLGVKKPPMTMILFYNRSGVLFNIHATGDVFLTFGIERDNGTHLEVAFRLTAYNVTVDVVQKNSTKLPVFWNESQIVSSNISKTKWPGLVEYKIHMKSLKIAGSYSIRKNDGMVIGPNGKHYGHTFLWYDPNENFGSNTPYVNLTPVASPLYLNGTIGLDKKLVTHYGTFGPPIGRVVLVQKNPSPIKVCFSVGTHKECPFGTGDNEIIGGITYDPASGITIAGDLLIPPADVRAIGIVYALFSDLKGAYFNEVKADYSMYPVLQIYDTNAEFQKAQEVPFSKAKTPWKYVFYIALTVLGIMAGTRSGGLPKW